MNPILVSEEKLRRRSCESEFLIERGDHVVQLAQPRSQILVTVASRKRHVQRADNRSYKGRRIPSIRHRDFRSSPKHATSLLWPLRPPRLQLDIIPNVQMCVLRGFRGIVLEFLGMVRFILCGERFGVVSGGTCGLRCQAIRTVSRPYSGSVGECGSRNSGPNPLGQGNSWH